MKVNLAASLASGAVALIVLCCAIEAAWAQGSIVANATKADTLFATDKRLNAPLTLTNAAMTNRRLLAEIRRATNTPITADESPTDIRDSSVSITLSDAPARAVMDALASLLSGRWERTAKNGYRLVNSGKEADEAFLPKNDYQRERFQAGMELLNGLNQLPLNEQEKVYSGQLCAVSALPEVLQQNLGRMVIALQEEYSPKGIRTFPPASIATAQFRLERKRRDGFNSFWITVRADGVGSSGFRFNDYAARKADRESNARLHQQKGSLDPFYQPENYIVSRSEAKRRPELQRTIELTAKKVTFPEAMKLLHQRYGINFVSDSARYMRQRADVELRTISLGQAMDKLTKLYKDTEWEWRKLGVIVIRGPMNPNRDGDKMHTSKQTVNAVASP